MAGLFLSVNPSDTEQESVDADDFSCVGLGAVNTRSKLCPIPIPIAR